MKTLTLTSRDDFGFVDRSDEATACAGGGNTYCQIIDDASVYAKKTEKSIVDRIFQLATDDSVSFPGMPTGRIPALYRAIIISRRFQALGNRKPTLTEMVRILSIVDGVTRGGRADDYWLTNALIRATLGLQLNADEKAAVESNSGYVVKTDEAGNQSIVDTSTDTGASGGATGIIIGVGLVAIAMALALGKK